MPSCEVAEIDVDEASATAGTLPSSASSSDASVLTVSQSQEEPRGGGETMMEENVNSDVVNDDEEDDHRPAMAQISPMPTKKVSALVTPRAPRSRASAKSTTRVSKKASSCAKGKMRGNKDGDNGEGSPTTPPSSSSGGIAVATPGEEENGTTSTTTTKKRKKGDPTTSTKTTSKKQPSTTLHSFFAKVDPTAPKTKKDFSITKVGGVSVIAARKYSTAVADGVEMSEEISATDDAPSTKKGKDKKKIKATTKKATASAKEKKSIDNTVTNDDDKATKKRVSSKKVKGVGAKANKQDKWSALEEIDDSPMYALAVVSQTLSASGPRCRSGTKKQGDIVDLFDESETNDDVMTVSASMDKRTDGLNDSHPIEAVDTSGINKDDSVEGLTFMGTDIIDANHVSKAAIADNTEYDFGSDSDDDDQSADLLEDVIINVDCEQEKDSVQEETSSPSTSTAASESVEKQHTSPSTPELAMFLDGILGPQDDDDTDDDATVELPESASNVPHSPQLDQLQTNTDVMMDEIPVEEDEAVLHIDAPKEPKACAMNASNNSVKDDTDAIESIEKSCQPAVTSSKLRGRGATPRALLESHKKAATTSPKRASKKSASASTTNMKGMSPIAASFKKISASPQKKAHKVEIQESPRATTQDSLATTSTNPLIDNLSKEDASRLENYNTLREKYVARAIELGNLPMSDDFNEECLSLESSTVDKRSVEATQDGVFPDKLLTHLQLLIQGRSQPLSIIAKHAFDELSPFITNVRPLTIESISSKIKLLAQRKSYLSGKLPTSQKSIPVAKLDCFENADESYMWRWELCSLDLIPQGEATKVKKARALRKKLQSQHRAISNLITAIDKALVYLHNKASTSALAGEAMVMIAKVSDMEEKVLKFEREEEKARLLKESKLRSLNTMAEDLAAKQVEKARLDEEKRNEKLRLEEEKRIEKQRKEEEKEFKKAEVLRLKNEENEKKKLELEEKEKKRKARMMSFFSKGSPPKKTKVVNTSVISVQAPSFDSDAFHKLIDSQDNHVDPNPFAKRSPRSKASRRWKTNRIRVSVFVTVLSENAFAPQPYDEERVIIVPNRYKFLGFHEDIRPPYRGTWSKRSSLITGRRPLGKDTTYLDYDIDSEEEWEEGDDEEGEDLVDDDDGADEEEDAQNDEDNDGWLADEDDLGIDDDDDETRALRKKNIFNVVNGPSGKPSNFKACVIAPRFGGLFHESFEDGNGQFFTEGFSSEDAKDALFSHAGCIITPDVSICLDAFPPSDSIMDTNQTKKDSSVKSSTPLIKELTPEAQKIMAQFVHNSTLRSKDLVVSELLIAHPTLANSRAQALRELDVISVKRRHGQGVLWEVKSDHLTELGLKEEDLVSSLVISNLKHSSMHSKYSFMNCTMLETNSRISPSPQIARRRRHDKEREGSECAEEEEKEGSKRS